MKTNQEMLNQLLERREQLRLGGGEERLAKQRAKGCLTARERIAALFDAETFQEWGMHVDHSCHDFGMEKKSLPGDGVVSGVGWVSGSPTAAFSQDATVGGGALGRRHAQKICDVMDYALEMGIPLIGINDSGGARIQEAVESLSGYGQVFYRNVMLSGCVPQISIIAGNCAGGAAYSPALTDFIIMTRENANMFICGPQVIKAVTGVDATMDEIGSASANAGISGNVHFVADNDQHAIEIARQLLSYLPANNVADPPHRPTDDVSLDPDEALNALVPDDPKAALDMYRVIDHLIDPGSFLEVHREFARNLIVGFARIDGVVVGIIANQPQIKAGALDIDASDKGARFIRFCNAFNIPLLTLVDVPGFLPGVSQEQGGIIRHGAKLLFAYSSATVPKITVITRKAYGGAYLAMCSRDLRADMAFAWPNAEIAVMGAEGAVNVLYRKELQVADDKEALRGKLIEEYRGRFASPYMAASHGMVTDVITPAETRRGIDRAQLAYETRNKAAQETWPDTALKSALVVTALLQNPEISTSMKKLRITIGDKSYDVTVEVLSDDTQPRMPLPAGAASPAANVKSPTLAPAPKTHGTSPETSATAGAVISPLAGLVVSILVSEGDDVDEGQDLVVLEAMKMENRISAATRGRVKSIHAREGETVPESHVLLVIE